jgi:hypothetical protein
MIEWKFLGCFHWYEVVEETGQFFIFEKPNQTDLSLANIKPVI